MLPSWYENWTYYYSYSGPVAECSDHGSSRSAVFVVVAIENSIIGQSAIDKDRLSTVNLWDIDYGLVECFIAAASDELFEVWGAIRVVACAVLVPRASTQNRAFLVLIASLIVVGTRIREGVHVCAVEPHTRPKRESGTSHWVGSDSSGTRGAGLERPYWTTGIITSVGEGGLRADTGRAMAAFTARSFCTASSSTMTAATTFVQRMSLRAWFRPNTLRIQRINYSRHKCIGNEGEQNDSGAEPHFWRAVVLVWAKDSVLWCYQIWTPDKTCCKKSSSWDSSMDKRWWDGSISSPILRAQLGKTGKIDEDCWRKLGQPIARQVI